MNAETFRKLALALPEATEDAHMGHPDFRVRRRIFATLGAPDAAWGMVKLKPAQQAQFVAAHPKIFQPVSGGWGERGATQVRLASAREAPVRDALLAAWKNAAPKRLIAEHDKC